MHHIETRNHTQKQQAATDTGWLLAFLLEGGCFHMMQAHITHPSLSAGWVAATYSF
jgi:hypothetical protein